jgi:hypothetical protein
MTNSAGMTRNTFMTPPSTYRLFVTRANLFHGEPMDDGSPRQRLSARRRAERVL